MRSFRRPCREDGFTLVEIMVAMVVITVVATAGLSVAVRTMQTTLTVTDRRDVFADGRFALDQMAKDLRQGESVDVTSDVDTVTVSTYLAPDGTAATVVWRATGTEAPYSLERSTDAGVSFTRLMDSLGSDQLFTYTDHEGVRDQVSIVMTISTRTSDVELVTDVYLRNAS